MSDRSGQEGLCDLRPDERETLCQAVSVQDGLAMLLHFFVPAAHRRSVPDRRVQKVDLPAARFSWRLLHGLRLRSRLMTSAVSLSAS